MDSNANGITVNAGSAAASAAGLVASGGSAASTAAASAASKQRQASAATAAATKQDTSLQRDPRSLQFQVEGNRVITTIVDENDNTVVVQVPDADMISLAKAIDRMQGFLVKDKA